MGIAIEILLEDETTRHLTAVWQRICAAGLAAPQTARRPYCPHISLIVADELDVAYFAEWTRQTAARQSVFELYLGGWGIFRTAQAVLFAGVKECPALTALQRAAVDAACDRGEMLWPQMDPRLWMPHGPLTARESFAEACAALASLEEVALPISAQAAALALVDFGAGEDLVRAPFRAP